LRVGKIRDLVEDLMQKYWNYLSRGTIAEGAKIKIWAIPVTFACSGCDNVFEVDIWALDKLACPECGGEKVSMLAGRELIIEDIVIT
jgi:hydrogenase nickel incorporation protein HypA/HybF